MYNKPLAITGGEAVAHAIRQINPEVFAAYPITPQTPIMETVAKFIANGKMTTEFIRAESEHSALAATVGASSAGTRGMTATASVGLALMWEVLGAASGMRLPIIMAIANRSISSPLNIHCDHSDSMGTRDLSWIQIYSENNQEAYENMLLALKIAEHPSVMLPAMVMLDGFQTSHNVENTTILPDSAVKKYAGTLKTPYPLLNVKKPFTEGSVVLFDNLLEMKRQQREAMDNALRVYLEVGKKLSKITKRKYPFFESYRLKDAKTALVVLSSTAGTAKVAIDELREEGHKVGLLKPILYRPFPYREIRNALRNKSAIAVMDRSDSYGSYPPLFSDISASLGTAKSTSILMRSFIFGLGGRDTTVEDIKKILKEMITGKGKTGEIKYVGLKK